VHHDSPGLPWYELPARFERDREAVLADNGGFLFRGYGEIVRRYALHPEDLPVYPGA
jgi:fatty acid desaturase